MAELTMEKVDLSLEPRILSNLIMSTELLAKVRQYADPKLMESSLSRIVCGWVFDFFDSTGKAPQYAIKDVFVRRSRSLESADREMVEKYLSNASDSWKPTNTAYMEDTCLKYFQDRNAAKFADEVAQAKADGDYARVDALVAKYNRPESCSFQAIDLAEDDPDEIIEAFENDEDIVVTLPGAYGETLGPLTTDDFVCFGAPPKRGKSWALMDLAWRTSLAGQPTVLFSLEMSKKQVIRRLWQMVTGRGRKSCIKPIAWFDDDPEGGKSVLRVDEYRVQAVDLDRDRVAEAQRKLRQAIDGGNLKILCFNTKQLTMEMLKGKLEELQRKHGFVPKCICVDYPMIMKFNPKQEKRFQLDDCFAELRGVGLEYHALVAAVHQMGRDTFTGDRDCSEKDLAECAGILSHVTKLVVLNQNAEDGKVGVIRAKCTTTRDGAKVYDEVVISQCLEIGRFYMDSRMLSAIEVEEAFDGRE